jgi:hypothetical protein
MGHKFINAVTKNSARPRLVGGINLFEDGTPASRYQNPVDYTSGTGLQSTRSPVDPMSRNYVLDPFTRQEDLVDLQHPNSLRRQQERRGIFNRPEGGKITSRRKKKREQVAEAWDRSFGTAKVKKLLWSPTARF